MCGLQLARVGEGSLVLLLLRRALRLRLLPHLRLDRRALRLERRLLPLPQPPCLHELRRRRAAAAAAALGDGATARAAAELVAHLVELRAELARRRLLES